MKGEKVCNLNTDMIFLRCVVESIKYRELAGLLFLIFMIFAF